MHCPKCGIQNPDNVQVCNSCNSKLPNTPAGTDKLIPKTSSLAIVAFVLGILSLFTCGLTVIPAIVLGIVSFVIIEKSGGKLTGTPFAILGVVVPVLIFFVLLWPMLLNIRQKAFRMICGTNLAEIGMSMLTYANDYDGKFPRSGGANSRWAKAIPDWKAQNRFVAYGLAADGSGGQGSITSCFYLLIKYSYPPAPRAFVCKGDAGVTVFNPAKEGVSGQERIDFWDFGPQPSKHCSYSYHIPFSQYALTKESDPGMAIVADRNPWQNAPAVPAKPFPGNYYPDGGREAIRAGNAVTHQGYVQNVLFVDFHVGQEERSFCGINDDNIYTFWDGGDIRIGATPAIGSEPMDRLDSLLVHDGS